MNPSKVDSLDQIFASRPAFPSEAILGEEAKPYQSYGRAIFLTALGQAVFEDTIEYVPRWIPQRSPMLPDRNYSLVEWINGDGLVSEMNWRFGYRSFHINSPEGGTLALRMYSWPGWQIKVNGKSYSWSAASSIAADGRLQLTVPSGLAKVQVNYKGTSVEQVGQMISFLCWVGIIIYLVLSAWQNFVPNQPLTNLYLPTHSDSDQV